ncbi:MAG: glycosyltransferase [Nanoarchaeota archaeon]
MKKISFIIAAHNEEKIIGNALMHLANLPYPNYEVILGLDGCTDKTLDIVKEFQNRKPGIFKYYELNERKGKDRVLNLIIPYATGEFIIIHDADWHFKVNRKDDLINMLKWFDEDPKLGGILESYPVEWEPERVKKNNSTAFLSIAWTSYFWIEYLKKYHSVKIDNKLYADPNNKNFPFELNIMRRGLYKNNTTLGDAWERALDVLEQGYKLRLVEDQSLPRMHASYDKARFIDIIQQKKRTARSRDQLIEKYSYINFNLFNFHIPLFLFIMKGLLKIKKPRAILSIFIWLSIMVSSMFIHNVRKLAFTTHKGWVLRANRAKNV